MFRAFRSRNLAQHQRTRWPDTWLWARRLAVWAILLAVLALTGGLAAAQEEGPAQAGLVVDFGGGNVHAVCVDLGSDGQATGEEVLQAAGFDVLMEYSAMGGAVCRIDSQGCDYPGEPCWCQCVSSPCVYWAYHHLVDGQWVYSNLGASTYVVHAGDVEGWAWGAGTLSQGAQPPLLALEDICAVATATATATQAPATATATPVPATATPTATATARPTDTPKPTPTWTWTPWPTATDTPSPTALAPLAAVTMTPTWTPVPVSTPTPAPLQDSSPLPASVPRLVVRAEHHTYYRVFSPLVTRGQGPQTAAGVSAPTLPSQPATPTALPSPEATATQEPMALALAGPSGGDGGQRNSARGGSVSQLPRFAQQGTVASAQYEDDLAAARASNDLLMPLVLVLAVAAVISVARLARRRPALGTAAARLASGIGVRSKLGSTPSLARATGQLVGALVISASAALGLVVLLYPFLATALGTVSPTDAWVSETPFLLVLLVTLCLVAVLVEIQGQAVSAKLIALLGVLVAINAMLRFVEVGIPGPGGFSPIFFLIVLTGYVYGARIGFLMGALTLLVSSLLTGGVGPWLPGQMFAAGWIGLTAPAVRFLVQGVGGRPGSRREVVVLAIFGGLWGLGYGMIMNLWFWPFMSGPAELYWQAGVGLGEVLQRYMAFYGATSLLWDALRLAGNTILILVFGAATLRALRRFRQRFGFDYTGIPAPILERVSESEGFTGSVDVPASSLSLNRGGGAL